jgi:hypothetical protein
MGCSVREELLVVIDFGVSGRVLRGVRVAVGVWWWKGMALGEVCTFYEWILLAVGVRQCDLLV